MSNTIPILDLSPEIEWLRTEIDEAFQEVLRHGHFIMGPEVQELEQRIAEYVGVKHAVGVNSGTDALVISLKGAGIGEGDEVITTSFTFFATAESIEIIGAKPVFTDVREETYNIDPNQLNNLLTGQTKAVLPVHLFGKPADMTSVMEFARANRLKVIEDCAQSFGAVYRHDSSISNISEKISSGENIQEKMTGSIGDAGAFSFFPSKNLGAFGDGGMITTNNDELAETARMLRSHGSLKKYRNEMMGYNSRLDSLQAAFLLVKLKYIDIFTEKRREAAHRYINDLSEVEEIQVQSGFNDSHVYHQFTVRILNGLRDDLADYLKKNGISTMIYYPVACHRLPVYNGKYNHLHLPVTERLTNEVLSLPIGPFLNIKDQKRITHSIKEFFKKN